MPDYYPLGFDFFCKILYGDKKMNIEQIIEDLENSLDDLSQIEENIFAERAKEKIKLAIKELSD